MPPPLPPKFAGLSFRPAPLSTSTVYNPSFLPMFPPLPPAPALPALTDKLKSVLQAIGQDIKQIKKLLDKDVGIRTALTKFSAICPNLNQSTAITTQIKADKYVNIFAKVEIAKGQYNTFEHFKYDMLNNELIVHNLVSSSYNAKNLVIYVEYEV